MLYEIKTDLMSKVKDLLVLMYEIGINYSTNSLSTDLNTRKKNSKLEMIRIFLKFDL
jgi:beta-lactamase class A